MVFSVVLDKQSFILHRLLDKFVGHNARVIDFTYGTGALWKDDGEFACSITDYKVTKCDRDGDGKEIIKKDIFTDNYEDLGKHKAAVFDPPYLIGRQSFDYHANVKEGKLVPMQYQGKRSWGTKGTEVYVANPTVEHFVRRVQAFNQKAVQVLDVDALLFVKIMDVRHKKKLIAHHITIVNELTNFQLEEYSVYIRQGATTWTQKEHVQILNGFWMVFSVKKDLKIG